MKGKMFHLQGYNIYKGRLKCRISKMWCKLGNLWNKPDEQCGTLIFKLTNTKLKMFFNSAVGLFVSDRNLF
jgi:hypothetical protein